MDWNKLIVLGIDGLGPLELIEGTNSECLKQKWYRETDLRDFFDVTDPKDFVNSLEVWSSIIKAKNLAGFAKNLQYHYLIGGKVRVKFPNHLGKWVEKKSYEENPVLEPIYWLSFLRDSGFIVELLWAFRWDEVFPDADKYNVTNLIAYNKGYKSGCKARRLMGEYLRTGSKYGKQRQIAVKNVKEDAKKDGTDFDLADIYAAIDKVPTSLMKRGKLRQLKGRREILRKRFKDYVGNDDKKTKNNFLAKLKVGKTDENQSRIDFGYFNKIDMLLHLFREKDLIKSLYSETVNFYNIVNKIADEQDRPLLVMSDHGMEFYRGAMAHSKRGFFSANYTFDELQENLELHPDIEQRFRYGMPKPQDLGALIKAHLTYNH